MNFDYAKKSKKRNPGATLSAKEKLTAIDKELKFFDTMLVIFAIILMAIVFGSEFWMG